MRSLLGRFHRPFARGTEEQLLMLNNLGDGSTLSLDFTTGVLDPRLTFTRLSLGTYVGPDGYLYGADSSTSSQTIGSSGTKTFTLSATAGLNRRYGVGDTVIASSGANNMSGTVTSYDPSTQVLSFTASSSTGSGTFTSWIIGTRMARFDYDPTSIGTPRGLLIEGSANNLMSYSEDFSNAAWTKSGTNGTMPLTGTAPDNNAASRLLEENTTTYAKHSLERSISISAGIHTFSVWLKEPSTNSRRYAHIQLADGQATAARYTIVADLQTGTIAASGANNGTAGAPTGTGHSITAYPGGWYRVTISMNHVSSPSYQVIVLGDSASLFGGLNQPFYSATTPYKGLLVWGAQLEAGSGASSYIPTGASQGSRAADICYADNISSWYTQGIGTMLFVGRPIQSIARNYLGFSTGTNPPRLLLYGSTATEVALYLQNSTAANLVVSSGSTTLGSVNRMAASFEQAGYSCVLNGGTVGTSTTASPAMPTSGINRMNIGMRNDQLNQFFGHVVQVKYWPYRLPNAQLQSLTT